MPRHDIFRLNVDSACKGREPAEQRRNPEQSARKICTLIVERVKPMQETLEGCWSRRAGIQL
jgi:hypothetical protein